MQQREDISPWQFVDDEPAITEQQVEEYQPQAETQSPKKSKKMISVNTSNARLEIKLLRKIIYSNGWKEVYQDGDVCWLGLPFKYGNLDEYTTQRVNRFPGMDLLAHKVQTAFYLKKFYQYFPEEYQFFPKSYNIPEEADLFQQEFKASKVYIVKPDAGSQGDGIYLLKSLKDLRARDAVVVQEYIHKPLLVDKKKFDLRLYVLITSLSPFVCYINKEGLARFCTVEYEKPTDKNLRNAFMHLSNYSLQKRSDLFQVPQASSIQGLLEVNEATKRTYSSVKKNLEILGYNIKEIEDRIDELVVAFLKALYPFLLYNCKLVFQKKLEQIKCFQVLGFDVLLDEAGKPWLLEVNSNPSVSIDHEQFSKDGKSVHGDSFIDEYVKRGVVQDAIILSMTSVQKQVDEVEELGTYRKLETEEEVGETVIGKMLQIYGYLSGYKFQEYLTASKFCKLAALPNMTTQNFVKYDYDLTFRKTMVKCGCNNQMDFFQFIVAFEMVAERLDEEVPDLVDRVVESIQS